MSCLPRKTSIVIVCGFVCGALLSVVCRADLVSYYNFDDGTTVTDLVGENHGTVIHNAGFVAETPDGSPFALDLSATGVGSGQDYVRIGPAVDGGGEPEDGRDFGIAETGSFSVSAWVNYEHSERGIVTIKQDLTSAGTDRSGVTFGIDAQERLFIGIIASTGDEFGDEANTGATFRDITTEDTVPTNEWVHIAATFDGEEDVLVGYINGIAADFYTVNPAGSIGDDGTDITGGVGIDFFDNDGSFTGFGAAGNGPSHGDSAGDFTRLFYDGFLDDVAIWNEAISEEDVQALASGAVKPPNLGQSLVGDYNQDGELNVADLDLQAAAIASGANPASFDLTADGVVDYSDRLHWVKQLKGTAIGDADLSGSFGTGDLVKIFQAAKFETAENASWGEGDFNGDLQFGTGDLVVAFQDGGFDPNANVATVPEPHSASTLIVCFCLAVACRRKRVFCLR
ncbi:MAG: hypothetical protein KDB27_05415 [Planctomycetales bacterium]|nr:hypothetical protein [Planctomycetales bacterium]